MPGVRGRSDQPDREDEVARRDRSRMVERQIEARGVRDPRVLDAMRGVPRHRFVPPDMVYAAYDDRALPIGGGQTISQPYMVALMTEALRLAPDDRLLEVGAGSGYQAAVAARLCREVWTVERVAELADAARDRLAGLGVGNVHVVVGDGSSGLPDKAPFDAIVVTAATRDVPPALFAQLADGGRLVVPLGSVHGVQTLYACVRHGERIDRTASVGCRFVPLIRDDE